MNQPCAKRDRVLHEDNGLAADRDDRRQIRTRPVLAQGPQRVQKLERTPAQSRLIARELAEDDCPIEHWLPWRGLARTGCPGQRCRSA